eukprot:scaffold13253_cov140-Isochrysis_galbana.AAC.2
MELSSSPAFRVAGLIRSAKAVSRAEAAGVVSISRATRAGTGLGTFQDRSAHRFFIISRPG